MASALMWIACLIVTVLVLAAVTAIKSVRVVHRTQHLGDFATTARDRELALDELVSRKSVRNACDYVVDFLDVRTEECHSDSYQKRVSGSRVSWVTTVRSCKSHCLSWTSFRSQLQHVKDGSLVYIPSPILNAIFGELCSLLRTGIYVVSNEGDEPVQLSAIHQLSSNDFVRGIYSCNWPLNASLSNKCKTIPIGIGNDDVIGFTLGLLWEFRKDSLLCRMLPRVAGRTVLDVDFDWVPVQERPPRVLCALGETGSEWTDRHLRRRCREYFGQRPELGHVLKGKTAPSTYFRLHRQFAFQISPFGSGMDCFRTWESILLGTIPIVFDAPNCDVFAELPVVVIRDLEEVTTELLQTKQRELSAWWDDNPNWRDLLRVKNFLPARAVQASPAASVIPSPS